MAQLSSGCQTSHRSLLRDLSDLCLGFTSCQVLRGIVSMVAALCPLYLPQPAAAQQDVTPPSLVNISVSPPSVNVATGPAQVTVTTRLTDDLSGVQQWLVQFNSPSNTQFVQVYGTPGLVAGTVSNGTFQGTSQVPQFAEAGIWRATGLSITDNAGNNTGVNLNTAGFPLSFTVASQQDVTPPSLVNISVSLPSVNVATGPAQVTVTTQLTDDLSGVQQWLVQFNSPANTQFVQVYGTPGLIAGTASNGTFQGTSQVPQFAEAGIWRATGLSITDNAGNNTGVNLNTAGFPLSFTVASQQDVTPPSLVNISVSPPSVDAATRPAPVTVTTRLTDDLSGVQQWLVQFNSPSSTQFVQVYGTSGLIAGTTSNGTFQGTSQVPQFAEAGIWRATGLSITDNAGNNTGVNLNTAGFPLSFRVVGADSIAPAASPAQAPPANGAGWNSTDVTVTWNWTDNAGGSGIDLANCNTSTVASGQGAAISATATCKDLAGNTGNASYSVNVDKTNPLLSITSPTNTSYTNTTVLNIAWTATDAGSGIGSQSGTLDGNAVTNGQAVDLFRQSLGSHVVAVNTSDKAGNKKSASVPFSITATASSVSASIDRLLATGAISGAGIANSLASKLGGGPGPLNAFLNQLDAQRGKGINQEAYEILKAAVLYLKANP